MNNNNNNRTEMLNFFERFLKSYYFKSYYFTWQIDVKSKTKSKN